jgi:hypothetical protein
MKIQEAVLKTWQFGPLTLMVDSHSIDRTIQRNVSPFSVDRVIKKLMNSTKELESIAPGSQVWVWDPVQEVGLGMRRLGTEENLRYLFKTVIGTAPYDGPIPVITV